MGPVLFVLAGVMALFGVLGYLFGSTAAFLVLVLIVLGLLVIANVGGNIITLINTVYRFVLAGGVQALSSGGDLGALRTRMSEVRPLIPSGAAGAVLLLLVVVLILFGILLGRYRRFRRPPSGVGLLIGLVNGYLVGAYLLTTVLPSLVVALPLPFGLSAKVAGLPPEAVEAARAQTSASNFGAQLLQAITGANPTSLALVVAILVAAIVLLALFLSLRTRGAGTGGNRRNGGARD